MAVGLFDPAVLETDPERRRPLLQVLAASLESVEPESAVHRWAQREGEEVLDLGSVRRVILVAFGKASLAMVRGLQGVLAGKQISGLIVAPEPPPLLPPPLAGEGGRAKRGREGALAAGFELITAGHPTPDGHSRQAAARALELAGAAQAEDLVVCLISGGGSALLELPAPGLDLHGLVTTTELLLRSGADIHQLNAVRKHLSVVKGGRLAQAAGPARLVTLVVSDVVGNPLDVIASGPTVPDPTTFHDALAVLDRFRLRDAVPQAVLAHLETGAAGRLPETPKDDAELPRQELVVVADGHAAAQGACRKAQALGLAARVVTTELGGEAREASRRCLAAEANEELLIFSGETTVAVRGSGRGGRNQEAALAAALQLEGDRHSLFAALATDGVDGPTDAAGGLVDGRSVQRGWTVGLDAAQHLAENDSYPFLSASRDLLVTGPTGTNVGDVWLVYRGDQV